MRSPLYTPLAAIMSSLFSELAANKGPVFNAQTGLGNTPNGASIDYLGAEVRMRPSVFLKLAAPLTTAGAPARVNALAELIANGTAIAPPFLKLEVSDAWRDDAFDGSVIPRVRGHDGRHRMLAISAAFGDAPVTVHLFLQSPKREWRGRHITAEVLRQLDRAVDSEVGNTRVTNVLA